MLTFSCLIYLIFLVLLQSMQIVLLYLNSPNLSLGNGLVVWAVAELGVLKKSVGLIGGFYKDEVKTHSKWFASVVFHTNEEKEGEDPYCCASLAFTFFSVVYAPIVLFLVYPFTLVYYLIKNLC